MAAKAVLCQLEPPVLSSPLTLPGVPFRKIKKGALRKAPFLFHTINVSHPE
jgi:hypothetical protein